MNEIKYVLYARKSTESEDKQTQSLDDQVEVMEKYAKERNLKIIKVFRESKSAKAPGNRPDFEEMIKMLKTGKASGIVSWANNRLSRNPTESGLLLQLLQDKVIEEIHTYDSVYTSEDDSLLFGVMSSMSNQFIIDLRKNVKRGIAKKASNGGISGAAPQGYLNDRINKVIIPDPERFDLIKRALKFFLTGEYSVPELRRLMNEEWGFTTREAQRIGDKKSKRGGQPVSKSGLYRMLANPRYAGQVPAPFEPGVFYPSEFEPMITPGEYDVIQKMLGEKGRPRLGGNRTFELRGLIRCGECGCMITAQEKHRKLKNGDVNIHRYYHCTHKSTSIKCSQRVNLREEDLYEQVDELLNNYEISDELYSWGMEALREIAKKEVNNRRAAELNQSKAVKKIQSQLDTLLQMTTLRHITFEEYESESVILKDKLRFAQEKQREQQERTRNWYEYVGDTLEMLTNVREKFSNGSFLIKKEIIQAIGRNPVLVDGRLIVTPNDWLIPIEKGLPELKEQISKVRTEINSSDENSLLDEEAILKNLWYTRQDSNLWPSAPQADALSS